MNGSAKHDDAGGVTLPPRHDASIVPRDIRGRPIPMPSGLSVGSRLSAMVLALAACCWLPMSVLPAKAAPLAKEECETLKAEQGRLVAAGLRAEMARGAAWAKANLRPERLTTIERLIEVDEQILFRCAQPQRAAVEAGEKADEKTSASEAEKPAAEAGTATTPAGKPEQTPQAATAVEPKAKKQRSQAKAKADTPAVPVADPAKAASSTSPPKKRAASKPKANDAYVPPDGVPQSVLKPPAEAGASPPKLE